MVNQLGTNQQSETTYAQALEKTAGTFRPSQELIQQTLTKRIQGNMSPQLRGQEIELQNKIMNAPSALREEFAGIDDPRVKRRLIAGREAQLFSQLSTMKDHRLAREGKYSDIVGSVALTYAAETEQLQFYAKEAQRKADQMQEIWEFAQKKKEAERTNYEWENFTKPRQALELQQDRANLAKTYQGMSGGGTGGVTDGTETNIFTDTDTALATFKTEKPDATRDEAEVDIRNDLRELGQKLSESEITSLLDKHYPKNKTFITLDYVRDQLKDNIVDTILADKIKAIDEKIKNKEDLGLGSGYSFWHSKDTEREKAIEKAKEKITNAEIEEIYKNVMKRVEELRGEGFTDTQIKGQIFKE